MGKTRRESQMGWHISMGVWLSGVFSFLLLATPLSLRRRLGMDGQGAGLWERSTLDRQPWRSHNRKVQKKPAVWRFPLLLLCNCSFLVHICFASISILFFFGSVFLFLAARVASQRQGLSKGLAVHLSSLARSRHVHTLHRAAGG